MSKYKVPLIFKWHYAISENIVTRLHFVKWWDRFKSHKNSITQGSPIPPIRLGSPTTSSSKPKSSKSKSAQSKPKAKTKSPSDELIQMAKLLTTQAKS
ncbi:hypothetical protein ACSBR2_008907 [Camellia fascicularis]